jgi:hypothetical protein
MSTATAKGRRSDPVKQFSVFTANRLGRLQQLVGMLGAHNVHVLALMVLETSDSATIRMVVDDPEQARRLLPEAGFFFTETDLLVVELDSAADLSGLMAALLQAELNIHYLYAFIPHPGGKSLLAFNMEDNEVAEQALERHQFRVLRQSDISR